MGNVSGVISPAEAQDIIGESRFFGRVEYNRACGIYLSRDEVPDMPFDKWLLKKARKRKMRLIFRAETFVDGLPINMRDLHEYCQPRLLPKEGNLLADHKKNGCWYNQKLDDFFYKQQPRYGWCLVGRDPIADSINVNYLAQTKAIVDYLVKDFFINHAIPDIYQQAIDEFNNQYAEFDDLLRDDTEESQIKLADGLSKAKINILCRRLTVEVLYDDFLIFKNKGKRRKRHMSGNNDWTIDRESSGRLVKIGHTGYDGAQITCDWPRMTKDRWTGNTGVHLALRC